MRAFHLTRMRLAFAAAFAVALALSTASASLAYHTAFVRNNCNYNAPTYTSYFTRDGSAAVAFRATKEGYQWGGGDLLNAPFRATGVWQQPRRIWPAGA